MSLPYKCYSHTARQLIEFPYGDGIEVAMGGGRYNFMPNTETDPEDKSRKGKRKDGRNLANEWKAKTKGKWEYVWNDADFKKLDINKVDHVLGKSSFFLSFTFCCYFCISCRVGNFCLLCPRCLVSVPIMLGHT